MGDKSPKSKEKNKKQIIKGNMPKTTPTPAVDTKNVENKGAKKS